LLKDRDEDVRVAAIFRLGNAPQVCWCPHHYDETPVGKRNDPRIMRLLLEQFKDPSLKIRLAATISLGAYRQPEVVDALLQALGDERGKGIGYPWWGEAAYPIGAYAAYNLGRMRDPRAFVPLLRELGSSDRQVRLATWMGLGEWFYTKSDRGILSTQLRQQWPAIKAELEKLDQNPEARQAAADIRRTIESAKEESR